MISGSARTLDPTNKNYAPELSTFGTIIKVKYQCEISLVEAISEGPSWSYLLMYKKVSQLHILRPH